MRATAAVAALAALLRLASAVPCVQFDTSWNLYAFGGSSDVNLGANTTWSSPSAQTLTTSGRPSWTGNYTQCLMSQYNNAMYVLGADSSDLSKIYIYSFSGNSWSTQSTTSAPSTLGNSRSSAVLDHDTNVLFTISGSTMYQLDMSGVTTSASSSALAWEAVENPSFTTDGYTVTAAQASNHINYFGVPGTAAGSADSFVVHYAYFQPTAQSYPTLNGGATFPDTAGQAFSIPDAANNVPYQMIFVPSDFSDTYVVSHWTNPSSYSDTSGAPYSTSLINTTQILPAPSSQDSNAAYAASPYALVQIDSTGAIYYLSNPVGADYTVQSGASWTQMSYSYAVSGATASSSASGSASASGASSGASGTASASKSGSSASTTSGAAASASASKAAAHRTTASIVRGDVLGLTLGVVAVIGGAML